jgi:cysteine synthase
MENMNPGGSHKIRIAVNMVLQAEKAGRLIRGSKQVLVDGSGGNAGIGIAMVANVLGYKAIIVVPKTFSKRKRDLIRAYGCKVLLSEDSQGPNSHFACAKQMCCNNGNYVFLGQTENEANPQAHWQNTAAEIIEDFKDAAIDIMICGVGSGGHISGIGHRLKKIWPKVRIIAVQPEGCDILRGKYAKHGIDGIGVGSFPVLDRSVVDDVVTVSTQEAISTSRQLMKVEGVSVGISSGANVFAAIQTAKADTSGKTILTFGYDNGSDYLESLVEG